MNFLISLLTTEAAKRLAVAIARNIAKRTDNDVDDAAVEVVAEALGIGAPKVPAAGSVAEAAGEAAIAAVVKGVL